MFDFSKLQNLFAKETLQSQKDVLVGFDLSDDEIEHVSGGRFGTPNE
jgi:hypothetical protein